MSPYEALYGVPCRAPTFWTKVGEKPLVGSDIMEDTEPKIENIF